MLLYGGGGHAKVVYDCILSQNQQVVGIFDENPTYNSFASLPFLGKYSSDILKENSILLSMGDNATRARIAAHVTHSFATINHVSAIISRFSTIGAGTMIFQNVIVNSHSNIGAHCILNTHSVIEHDCFLEDFVHIATNACLCGGVKVGIGSIIGAGAIVLPQIKIGKWSTIGAGAVVTKDVPDFETVVGNPAKQIPIK